jgi:hypothetical protein
VDHLAE